MPTPFADGSGWSSKPLSTEAEAEWLRGGFKRQRAPAHAYYNIRAHTMKITLLARAAKAGIKKE